MNIILGYRQDIHNDRPVECYARSAAFYLEQLGHKVISVGEGHGFDSVDDLDWTKWDAFIEIDNGRNKEGKLFFQQPRHRVALPTAVWLIDSHGQSDVHKDVSSSYDHVFFAVWDKRGLFNGHPSAHWCPNASDPRWFSWEKVKDIPAKYDFGFIGSKGGIHRTDALVEICEKNGYTYTVKQVSKAHRHKWPHCAEAMAEARFLFNRGQKHDGPNQRVIESMLLNRPVLTDLDERDGMSKIFTDYRHFVGYKKDNSDLEEKMKWMMGDPYRASRIAYDAYLEAYNEHTVKVRMKQILEVLSA
jgi:hypothetical protein